MYANELACDPLLTSRHESSTSPSPHNQNTVIKSFINHKAIYLPFFFKKKKITHTVTCLVDDYTNASTGDNLSVRPRYKPFFKISHEPINCVLIGMKYGPYIYIYI